MTKKIFIASKNKGKIREIKNILSEFEDIEIYSFLDDFDIPEVVEDGLTFEENSLKKAKEISKFINMYTIADDSGLCVDALDGKPGIHSARYSGNNSTDKRNNEKLLNELKDIENRKAKFISVVTFYSPENRYFIVRGELHGEILKKGVGDNGFGYDPIFYVKDYNKSLAELTKEEKNSISHRRKALDKLKNEIKNWII